MKNRMIAVLCLLVCAAAVFGCAKGAGTPSAPQSGDPPAPDSSDPPVSGGPEPPAPGGTTDATDPNAPKTIGSTEIASFSCTVSMLTVVPSPEYSLLTSPRYEFSAKREGGKAVCACVSESGERAFEEDAAFFDRLQQIVAKYDLASYNGIYRWTHGLPEDFGYSLAVEYASGERIAATNNQTMDLPLGAAAELAELFGAYQAGVYTSISMEEATRRMEEENGFIVDVRTQEEYAEGHIPGAVCIPMEAILAGEADGAFAPDQLLFVYCRSGRRSKIAAQRLADAGYTNVVEFGGILDWKGEIEKN